MRRIYLGLFVGAMVLGAAAVGSTDTFATSKTLNPGDDVWAAVNQLAAGDTLTLNAGTYALNNYINIVGKNKLTLVGVGEVILEYDGAGGAGVPGIKQAIQIYNSQNIKVSNFTVRAVDDANESAWATASIGVGVNSSCGIELDNLKIEDFGKSAITITGYQDGTETCASGDIVMNNISMAGDGAGVMFTNGNAAPAIDISGVVFTGTTTITGVAAGIVTDAAYDGAVTGADGGELSLGVVNITTTSGQYAVALNTSSPAAISKSSVIGGKKVSEMTPVEHEAAFGANVAARADAEVPAEVESGVAVPATGSMMLADGVVVDMTAVVVAGLVVIGSAGVVIRWGRRLRKGEV